MDEILNGLDQLTSLDNIAKYSLIILNFITIGILYFYKKMKTRPKQQQKHNILLVIAHPDDEAMFFQPTIHQLNADYVVHILCLWSDDVRQKELEESLTTLNITHLHCVKDDRLVDGLKEKWDQHVIRDEITRYAKDNNIKAIFTFDDGGVSGHPNHIAICKSLKELVVPAKTEKSIKMYELQSVNLIRKYSGVADLLPSLLADFMFTKFNPIASYRTMSKHVSQFVWYRRLFLIFSRYGYVNTYGQPKFIEVKSDS